MTNREENLKYPIRINKYIALKGICSRREADKFVSEGLVKINGKIARLGDKVNQEDKVTVGKAGKPLKNLVYFAYNKPKGIITSNPQGGQKEIKDVVKIPEDAFPIGRLDKDSHGLIIITNDGRINQKLLDPENYHEKEYIVSVNKKINNFFIKLLGGGIQLEDFKTRTCVAKKIDDYTFKIVLTEGKKHQIRRMCAALGYEVRDLQRVRLMNIKLNNLQSGKIRMIEKDELEIFLKSLGIS